MPKESQFKDYFFPKSVEEALILSKSGKSKIIGGGTTFFELAQRGLFSDAEYVIDLKEAGLDYLREDTRDLKIGATITMSNLLSFARLSEADLAGISDALKCVEPLQVRNVATIGGTVCASIPFFDMPIALCAVGALALLRSSESEREVPIEELYIDNLVSGLRQDEILLEVRIPKMISMQSASSFVKHSRTGFDIGTVTCGMAIGINDTRKIERARVFIGNVSNTPFRANSVENVLIDKDLSTPTIIHDIEKSLESLEPSSSLQGSSDYKKQVSKVLVRKAFETCRGRIVGKSS